jgi:hypothetical protein
LVGGTTTEAKPAKETRPTLYWSGSSSTKSAAAALAASIRLGSTSVAIMDSEMSMARMTVARSWGSSTSTAGRVMPPTSTARAMTRMPAGRWRRQPGTFGTSLARREAFANRTATRLRANWAQT